MSSATFFPWQAEIAKNWLGTRERFAHAWLIHGLAGIGKREFALAAAAALLCESPVGGLACGKCLACGWVVRGNHPDLKRIRPEALALEEGADDATAEDALEVSGETPASGTASKRAPSKDIRVDQIRSMESWFNHATHRGGWRVAVIYPAEALTTISGNSLLKVLEEPPAATVFLLVADAPDRLLPTLLSRCRRLALPTPSHADAMRWLADQGIQSPDQWLAAAGGAPVQARRLAQSDGPACPLWLDGLLQSLRAGRALDLGALADAVSKTPTPQWLDAMSRVAVDLNLVCHGLAPRYFPGIGENITDVVRNCDVRKLSELSKWFAEQSRIAGHPLNAKLFAQSALQRLVTSCQPVRAR
jgi:DNA polymerase III subunit delta'